MHIEWADPNTDWDLYVVNAETGEIVTQSAAFGDTTEDAALYDPPPGDYVAHVVNYDQVDGQPYDDWTGGRVTFDSPRPRTIGETESWTLTCTDRRGRLQATEEVVVGRGQRREPRRRLRSRRKNDDDERRLAADGAGELLGRCQHGLASVLGLEHGGVARLLEDLLGEVLVAAERQLHDHRAIGKLLHHAAVLARPARPLG